MSPQHHGNASLANWRQQPHSHWAFHHVDALIRTDPVKSSTSAPAPFQSRLQSFADITIPAGKGASLGINDFLEHTDTDGLVILHNGKLVYEFYDHDMTRESCHIIMSATKSVVGLLVGILSANGTLDVDVAVTSLVPEVAATAYQVATIRDLIDMRTGVKLDASDFAAYAAAAGWEPVPDQNSVPGLHAFLSGMHAPLLPHGGSFSYISANTDLLGWAIERASGEKFATLLSRLFWQPLGAEHDAYITLDRHGAARCTGGLCCTLLDLARVGQLVADSGKVGNKQLVTPAWLDDIATMGDKAAWDSGEFANAFAPLKMSYRSGWYVIEQPKMMFAMGIHGQNLFVDPASQLVIAKVSSQQVPIDPVASGLTLRAVMAIRHFLTQQSS